MADRIVIAGGTGFIGQALARAWTARGGEAVILSRNAKPDREPYATAPRLVAWDARLPGPWARALEGAAAVVNLAGHTMNCVHSPENRRRILESRLQATRAIGETIERCANPPAAWIQASAVGYYGNAGEHMCAEDSPPGSGFAAEVCRQWESAQQRCLTPATRQVRLRIGLVLGTGGGALPSLARLTRLFLGGAAGSGRQFVSWIHIDDLVAMILEGIDAPRFQGTFNAVSPHPVRNAKLMRTLRRVLHRPWSPPVPTPFLRLGALWIMRTDADLVLSSCRAVPARASQLGFSIQHPDLESALRSLLKT